jgi:cytidine deaminase
LANDEKLDMTLPACRKAAELMCAGTSRLPADDVISDLTCRNLIKQATKMLDFSYTPYSGFKVGAALLTKDKQVFTGCNIENAAYSPTNCAERTAIFKAISEGVNEFAAIAIVGGKDGVIKDLVPPCGVCRQVMAEFCVPEQFYVILARSEEDYWVFTLAELLPMSFTPENLG